MGQTESKTDGKKKVVKQKSLDPEAQQKRQKQMAKRKDILVEVTDTERRYVLQLNILVTVWLPGAKKLKLKEEDIRSLFSIVEILFAFHEKFLSDLEGMTNKHLSTGGSPEELCIGDLFVKNGDFLRNYKTYVNNFDVAASTLTRLKETNAAFVKYLDETRSKPECANLDLMGYLITPVQRLPRYKLLLEDLLRNTPEDHDDFEILSDALEKVVQVANFINEEKRKQENTVKVMQIQSNLVGSNADVVEPHRKFIEEGKMTGFENNNNKEFHYFLFNDLILLTIADKKFLKDSFRWKVKVRAPLVLAEIRDVQDIPNRRNCFELVVRQDVHLVGFDTAQEKEEFMKLFLLTKAKSHSFFSSKEQLNEEKIRQNRQTVAEHEEKAKEKKQKEEKVVKASPKTDAKANKNKEVKDSPKVEKTKKEEKAVKASPKTDAKANKNAKEPAKKSKKDDKQPLLDKKSKNQKQTEDQGCSCLIL